MAEVTGLRNNALPYPVYGVPFGIEFPILDADGDLVTGATGLDSERSLNGDTFADCTNEATEIATSSGMYYLLLTAAEMTADVVAVIVKTSSSGAKTTVLTLYPRKLVALRSGTAQGGAAGYITLDASAGAKDDIWNGCLCVATIDSNVEARVISDYTGSSQQAAVVPNWNVTPDSDDTFIVYLPEGRQINEANLTTVNSVAATATTVPTVAEIADGVWDEDATAHQTQGTFGQAIGDPAADTNSIFKATVTDATGATVGVDVVALKAETVNILADTAEIGAAGAGLTALATQASVNTIDTNLDAANGKLDVIDGEVGVIDGVLDLTYALVGTAVTDIGNLPSTAEVQSAADAAVTANVIVGRVLQRLGFLMAQEIGVCADAGTAAESYTITINSTTYTVDHVGLDSTGNRGTAVLTES